MKKTVAIIGAGITGLALGSMLAKDYDVLLIEKEKTIGGICSSFSYKGFILDYGPHKLYPQSKESAEYIRGLYRDTENLRSIKKSSKIFIQKKFFSYPLQIKEILLKFNPILASKLMISYFLSLVESIINKRETPSYEDFLISKFGKGIYSLVFQDNAKKIWGNPKQLSSDLAKTRVSSPNLMKVIANTLFKSKDPSINAEYFLYPKKSIQDLMDRMAAKIISQGGKIISSCSITKVKFSGKTIKALTIKNKGKLISKKIDYLVSTARPHFILELLNSPEGINKAIENLKFRDLALVYLFINKEKVLNDNWTFFPEKDFIFQRISEQKSFSDFNQPRDKSVITAEISIRPEIANMDDKTLQEQVIRDLEKAKIIKKSEVYSALVIRKKNIYPLYDLNYKKNLNIVLNWLDSNFNNFITCGRNGLFNYNNMDHCIDMASKIAEYLKRGASIDNMIKLRKYFETYKIVD